MNRSFRALPRYKRSSEESHYLTGRILHSIARGTHLEEDLGVSEPPAVVEGLVLL